MSKRAVLRAAALLTLFCVSVFAQRDLGTIVGTVTDPQGGAIANAKVTITEGATGQSTQGKPPEMLKQMLNSHNSIVKLPLFGVIRGMCPTLMRYISVLLVPVN